MSDVHKIVGMDSMLVLETNKKVNHDTNLIKDYNIIQGSNNMEVPGKYILQYHIKFIKHSGLQTITVEKVFTQKSNILGNT